MGGDFLEKLTALNFENFQDYFKYRLKAEIRSNTGHKKSSLEKLAKQLGYNSPSSLSMIFTGDRLPSNDFLDAIFEYWHVSSEESQYLRSVVQLEKLKRKGKATAQVIARLDRFKKVSRTQKLNIQQFSLMSDWYHLVVKSLVSTFDFREDHNWINRRLRKKLTASQIKKSIEVLLELGLIERDPDGTLKQATQVVETTHDLPSEAIREHHKGMMQRAIEAIDEQEVTERHFNSLTLKFDPKHMPEAKEKILNFVKDFNSRYLGEDSNRVFQLNVQLFEHTKEEKVLGANQNAEH